MNFASRNGTKGLLRPCFVQHQKANEVSWRLLSSLAVVTDNNMFKPISDATTSILIPCSCHQRDYQNGRQRFATSNNQKDDVIFYERKPAYNKLPQGALGVSVANTVYWTWYTFDFIPTVNASPIEALHVDPRVGLFGIGLGVSINIVTVLYPMSLVSVSSSSL